MPPEWLPGRSGLLGQGLAFGVIGAGVSTATDFSSGVVDRFRSLPVTRLSVISAQVVGQMIEQILGTLIVVGLGVTWILDGLEVTIVGALGPALQNTETLHLSSADLGGVASFYVIGAVTGALVSGWVTDRFGRRLDTVPIVEAATGRGLDAGPFLRHVARGATATAG